MLLDNGSRDDVSIDCSFCLFACDKAAVDFIDFAQNARALQAVAACVAHQRSGQYIPRIEWRQDLSAGSPPD